MWRRLQNPKVEFGRTQIWNRRRDLRTKLRWNPNAAGLWTGEVRRKADEICAITLGPWDLSRGKTHPAQFSNDCFPRIPYCRRGRNAVGVPTAPTNEFLLKFC